MIKVIIDTNILIDSDRGPFSDGSKIIELVNTKKIQSAISPAIENEYELKVQELITDQELKEIINQYLQLAEKIYPHKRVYLIKDDPDDNKFLEAADYSKANYIITSDHHLLDFKKYKKTLIIKPKDFINIYRHRDEAAGNEVWKTWVKDILQSD